MRYAKLIDGKPVYAPNPILHNSVWYGNPPAEVLEAEGYKPVRYSEPPETESGYIAVPSWEETPDTIVQAWTIKEAPDEIDAEEAMNILFGGVE